MNNKLTIFLVILTMLICYGAGYIGGYHKGFTAAGAKYYDIVQRYQGQLSDYYQLSVKLTEEVNQQQAMIDTWEALYEGKITIEITPIPERIQ